jgi:tetratricopeptide (TPR) repeat protein
MKYLLASASAGFLALVVFFVVRGIPPRDWTAPPQPEAAANAESALAGGTDNAALQKELMEQLDAALVAVKAAPKDLDALVKLGNLQFSLGKIGEARVSFDRALAVKADSIDAIYGVAACRSSSGDFEGALRDYVAIRKSRPDDPGLEGVIKQLESLIDARRRQP